MLEYLLVSCRALLSGVAYGLRLIAFAVLAVLEPFVAIVLSLVAIAGFATCILYRFLFHAPHFPTALMLTLSIAAAALLALYRLAMRVLTP